VATAGTSQAVAVSSVGSAPVKPVQKKTAVSTLVRPTSDDGLWIQYGGARWISAGEAVQLSSDRFRQVGKYSGFPVYQRQGGADHLIYVPTRNGFVAPYKLKP
jgi:hypothetical protein